MAGLWEHSGEVVNGALQGFSGYRAFTCPKALRTDGLRLLSPKTIPYKAFGLFGGLVPG